MGRLPADKFFAGDESDTLTVNVSLSLPMVRLLLALVSDYQWIVEPMTDTQTAVIDAGIAELMQGANDAA